MTKTDNKNKPGSKDLQDSVRIIVISDGTGETAANLTRAALIQFKKPGTVLFTRYNNVRTKEQVDSIMEEATIHQDLVVYTIVDPVQRSVISELAKKHKVVAVDILGPIMKMFTRYFEISPKSEPGIYREVNERYFNRIDAIEYTIAHDDGKNFDDLDTADIVILGVSRTSKTPLSMYLSTQGWRVVNIPIVKEIGLPDELKKIDQRKIIGLTIDPNDLSEIRKQRLTRLGQEAGGNYAELAHVLDELEYADELFSSNRRWPIFNVTGKALEETAAEISKLFQNRFQKSPKESS